MPFISGICTPSESLFASARRSRSTPQCPQGMQVTEHKILHVLNVHYADRFLAKVTLGLGALLLDSEIRQSESARLLRELLWTKDPNQSKALPVIGKRFFDGADLPLFAWPNGPRHTVTIMFCPMLHPHPS